MTNEQLDNYWEELGREKFRQLCSSRPDGMVGYDEDTYVSWYVTARRTEMEVALEVRNG